MFVDNCSRHNMNERVRTALENTCTEIRYLPDNATDLIQSADSFIIHKIKEAWSKRWESYKEGIYLKHESLEDLRFEEWASAKHWKNIFAKVFHKCCQRFQQRKG